jgi:hypothetical protein
MLVVHACANAGGGAPFWPPGMGSGMKPEMACRVMAHFFLAKHETAAIF